MWGVDGVDGGRAGGALRRVPVPSLPLGSPLVLVPGFALE